jgi:hypothetical protein
MAYFNELPFIQYPLRFENQSSNQDYTTVRNIFRRAKIQERIANYATSFEYYQVKDNERPDELAERFYGDAELDWVILITNNITSFPSKWPLSNNSFYEYLIDKYGSDEAFEELNFLETNEVRDEYNRLVVPGKLKTDPDFYEEFTTVANKDNPLFYDLKFYPIPSDYYNLKITTNLGSFLEVWERDNLGEGEEYKGQEYNVSEIYLQQSENPEVYQIGEKLYPDYTRLDYSYLFVYDRNGETKPVFNPITLNGWPYTWGNIIWIYGRENKRSEVNLKSNINFNVDITDDFRLYDISSIEKIDTFTYTDGTTLPLEASKTYIVENLKSSNDGIKSSFEIKRNSKGEVITVKIIDGGRNYIDSEVITVSGSLIGGVDFTDDIQITVKTLTPSPQFRFVSIGSQSNVPFPGVKVTSLNKTGMSYLNTLSSKVEVFNNQNPVNNYEYENVLNEETRQILVLKPSYLGAFIGEFRNMMRYDDSTETVTNRIKQVYNPRIIGQ